MDKSGFEEISEVVGSVPSAEIVQGDFLLAHLTGGGVDISAIEVRVNTPEAADEVKKRLGAAGLLAEGYLGRKSDLPAGEGPLLWQTGFTTTRNVPPGTFPGLIEELRFEDLRSPAPAETSEYDLPE